ncbi:HD domain-containing protein [Shewanella frigidimarina]|uniref:HD domain-containing protein n=1 Tax=Shewanella frigidimarina TaxID=56812 RepID=UPI003D791038
MNLILPRKFRDVITKKASLSGALDTLIDIFSEWLTHNKTDFFPEYTDHGIDHIQSVIDTAEEIISDEAWKIITPEDVYVLTSSILLHDCAMHLSKDGLWDLLSNGLYNGVLFGFDNEDEWSVRWEQFCKEVKRFDEHDYSTFFGEFRKVTLPEVDCASLDDNQKIIIGDFVRRYHACISQVISTYGIPSKNGPTVVFNDSFNYLNQLSGFIARSHNHPLREVVDLLGDERKREHRETHPTYLMGVLRIADYLQLKSDRTPKILFKTIGFCSPISIKEWKKHLSIISTNNFHPDDELLFIEAYPEDAITLVGIKHLLSGLQKELDEFWAVSGEVYSRYNPLNSLTIKYRRVKSNIDNPIKYVEDNHKTYHPEVLSVKADDQKLFPLLIKPLYGDLPQIGLRELLQNSLDATNERYSQETSLITNYETIPHSINIKINFNDNTFILKDNGVGMNIDVIRNYFLKIGSSYRTSEQWKSDFNDNDSTKIPRTGKFGIGMLAGFLIGDKIEVITTHMNDHSKSIRFAYKLDSNEIELKFINKSDIGTSIIVHSDKARLETLRDSLKNIFPSVTKYNYYRQDINPSSWWYFLDTPNIITEIIEGDKSKEIRSPYIIKKETLDKEWTKIVDSRLDGFYWRHNSKQANVYCNGIMIQKMPSPIITITDSFNSVDFSHLEICSFDNSAEFPLNLTRDELVTKGFYEEDKLRTSVLSDFIEKFNKFFIEYVYGKNSILSMVELYSKSTWSNLFIPLIFKVDKVIPFGKKDNEEKYTLVDFIYSNQKRGLIYSNNFESLKNDIYYSCFENSEKKIETIENAINFLLLFRRGTEAWRFASIDEVNDKDNFQLNSFLYLKEYDFEKIKEENIVYLKERGVLVTKLSGWVVMYKGSSANPLPELGSTILNSIGGDIFMFALYKTVKLNCSEFSDLWEERFCSNNE